VGDDSFDIFYELKMLEFGIEEAIYALFELDDAALKAAKALQLLRAFRKRRYIHQKRRRPGKAIGRF
jgi:hypothetical protein